MAEKSPAEKAELIERIRDLRGRGIPLLDISLEVGVTSKTVGRWCREYGIGKGEK